MRRSALTGTPASRTQRSSPRRNASSITRWPATGTVRTLAEQLGQKELARILQQTLDEEGACDKKLTKISESSVNVGRGTVVRPILDR